MMAAGKGKRFSGTLITWWDRSVLKASHIGCVSNLVAVVSMVVSDVVVRLPVDVLHMGQVRVNRHWLVVGRGLQSSRHSLCLSLALSVVVLLHHLRVSLFHGRSEISAGLVTWVLTLRVVRHGWVA